MPDLTYTEAIERANTTTVGGYQPDEHQCLRVVMWSLAAWALFVGAAIVYLFVQWQTR